VQVEIRDGGGGAGQRVLSLGTAPAVPSLHPSPSGALPRRAGGDGTQGHPLARPSAAVPNLDLHNHAREHTRR